MKYENIKLLFQQDKYVQFGSLLFLGVFVVLMWNAFEFAKGLDEKQHDAFYWYVGDVAIQGQHSTGKSWVLAPCEEPAGYCWKPIITMEAK